MFPTNSFGATLCFTAACSLSSSTAYWATLPFFFFFVFGASGTGTGSGGLPCGLRCACTCCTRAFTMSGNNCRPMKYDAAISKMISIQCFISLHSSWPGQTLPNYTDVRRSLWFDLRKYCCIVKKARKTWMGKLLPGMLSRLWFMINAMLYHCRSMQK